MSTDELITVMFEAKFFILFLNFVAPIALEPIPASQANTILLITSLLITTSSFSEVTSSSSLNFLLAFLTNGAATTNDTAVEARTPAKTPINPPFGANAIKANILPGDGIATSPALKIENINIPAALPTIGAIINTGFINTYGK